MAKRKPKDPQSATAPLGGSAGAVPVRPLRLLAVSARESSCDEIERSLGALDAQFDRAASLTEARVLLGSGAYDVVIVEESLPDGAGLELVREIADDRTRATCCVVVSERADLGGAVDAMRSGATDFVTRPFHASELARRVTAAAERAARLRDEQRRVDRLKRICKRLNTAREEVSKQVDDLCNDLVTAYQDLADQMTSATMASEFSAIVRQELDVEALLRTTLEYMLGKTGPTNAAVFLPTGHEDYSLGAYVNYDVPRDTADVLLDHLADVIAPKYDAEPDVRCFATASELDEALGEDAAWLNDSALVVFACRDEDGDCLAVFALFRDRRNAFTEATLAHLRVIRDIFGEQLARVVRIHHRHTPDKQWPGFDIEEDDRGTADDHGLAA